MTFIERSGGRATVKAINRVTSQVRDANVTGVPEIVALI